MAIDRPSLRKRIREVLVDDSDLNAFCTDHFPGVSARFTDGMNRVQKVTMLLERADPEILDRLLGSHDVPPQPRPSRARTIGALAGLTALVALAPVVALVYLTRTRPETPPTPIPAPSTAMPGPSGSTSPTPIVPTSTAPTAVAASWHSGRPIPPRSPLAPTSSDAPPSSNAPSASLPPTAVSHSGAASCEGARCTLSGLDPSIERVCLSAPNSAPELAGHEPHCTISAGAVCYISSPVLTAPLKTPITWRSPCP